MHASEKMILPEELKGQFRNLINSRCGLYFKDYDLKDLERAIAMRMKACGLASPISYYNTLTVSDKREDEFRELLNILTVKHTYFFRNEPQFKALKEKILPHIMERRAHSAGPEGKPILRIWSAGCSTGEEPYSIAMVIRDILPDTGGWDIQIVATDASTEAIANARKGLYGDNSMRLVDKYHRDRYFTETGKTGIDGRYQISEEIRKMVNFDFFNLMEAEYPGGFDIIFCRNVVIYFELETTIRVMNKFARSLKDDGCLFIGYSESLQFVSEQFNMVDWEDAIFYVKEKAPRRAFRAKPPAPSVAVQVEKFISEVSRAEIEAETQAEAGRRRKAQRFKEVLIDAVKASHLKQYEQALSLVDEARSIDENAVEPYYLAAEILANRGSPGEAKDRLKEALHKNMLFAPAHYLLGTLHLDEGDLEEAEKSLKKALYIDKDFSLAHFGLGNIYRDTNRPRQAIREYRNTLNILVKSDFNDIIAYSGGFSAATLSSACKNNVERLKVAE